MSFKTRLSRLATPSTSSREDILDDLRTRMRRVLERTSLQQNAPRPMPIVTAEESDFRLPFFAEETPHGLLHRRVLRLSPAHRTGRAYASVARTADVGLLSLLALDASLAKVDLSRALYLDTETTGLAGGTGTVAFLVGLATFDEHGAFVEQLLVRNLGEEAPMLAHVRGRALAASSLVTFNGKSFDMPLLRTRMVMARLEPLPDLPHLDLLHVARRVHRKKHRLTALEDGVLGYERIGDVPSGQVSARYLEFLRTGRENALLGVVEHNAQDVITMLALVGLYGEPLESSELAPADLVGVANTLRRAGDHARAFDAASMASDRGAGPEALRARAAISRARGDRSRALSDLESLLKELDCPRARLDLAKLYEHFIKDAHHALTLVDRGVAEDAPQSEKRRARLTRKIARQMQRALFDKT